VEGPFADDGTSVRLLVGLIFYDVIGGVEIALREGCPRRFASDIGLVGPGRK
jgi:hypothetical protein